MKILKEYFNNDKIMIFDRAFLALYSLLKVYRKNTEKNKILFTSITCASPVYAAIYAGFEPVFIDINLKNYLMDTEKTIKEISENGDIAGLVYIYTFGHTTEDIFEIKKRLDQEGAFLIEDCAQSFGARIGDNIAGTIGDYSIFSFGYSKQIEVGKGGLLINNCGEFALEKIDEVAQKTLRYDMDKALSEKYREEFYRIRKEAISNPNKYFEYNEFIYDYEPLYFKKIDLDRDEIEKKVINYIQNDTTIRRMKKASQYHEKLIEIDEKQELILPEYKNNDSIYRYTFLFKDKKKAQIYSEYLRKNGINCSNLYIPVSRFFEKIGYENSIYFAERVINLWVDDTVDQSYIDKTIKLTREFLEADDYEEKYTCP